MRRRKRHAKQGRMPAPVPRGNRVTNWDGEAVTIELVRREPDTSLRGQIWSGCCDCNLHHLVSFEVFQDGVGNWFLNKRAYRLSKETALDAGGVKVRK